MKTFPDESFDLVVTSPPYNLRNTSGGGLNTTVATKWQSCQLRDGYNKHCDNMPHEEYVEWQRLCLTEMMRLLSNDGAIFYNHKWRVQNGLLQDRADIVAGFPVRQIIIWRRKGGFNFNHRFFLPTYEVIYLIAKPDFKLAPKGCSLTDVWDIAQERNNPHPAPFPVELPYRCIKATNANRVLDPFVGSGSTAIAAQHLGRDYVGIEASPEYCELARDRLKTYTVPDYALAV